MEPIWGRQDPGGPHVGPMNFAIWVAPSKTNLQYSTHIFNVSTHGRSDFAFKIIVNTLTTSAAVTADLMQSEQIVLT